MLSILGLTDLSVGTVGVVATGRHWGRVSVTDDSVGLRRRSRRGGEGRRTNTNRPRTGRTEPFVGPRPLIRRDGDTRRAEAAKRSAGTESVVRGGH